MQNKFITHVNAEKLAIGLQKILLELAKNKKPAKYPVEEFERLIMESKQVSKIDAEYVTERVIGTGIIRWSLGDNCFVL